MKHSAAVVDPGQDKGYMQYVLTPSMTDVTDDLRVIFTRPNNHGDVFVKRQALI